MESIRVFSPASVSNLGCGFDILGFALEGAGDIITVKKTSTRNLQLSSSNLEMPILLDTSRNTASVAVSALLKKLNSTQGFTIDIYKGIMPGSGIGSSAASAAGTVFAVNELLDKPFNKNELIEFAMEGEAAGSGAKHADNVAPALLGGIILIRSYDPFDIVKIPSPKELYCVLLHPQIEVKTLKSRDILNPQVNLRQAVKQWGNVGGLIAGFYTEDYELIGRSIEDHIIESQRAHLIKNYWDFKNLAYENGALACNISGAGPSIFTFTKGIDIAEKINSIWVDACNKYTIPYKIYTSKINERGVNIIS